MVLQVLEVNIAKKNPPCLMYNGTVTKISSCQVYEISRKELNWQQVLLFLFPFVSHEST